jgi:hypothetical protein
LGHPLPTRLALGQADVGKHHVNGQWRPAMDGLDLVWQIEPSNDQVQAAANATRSLAALPRVHFGGYELPMQLQPVLLKNESMAPPKIQWVESTLWAHELPLAAPQSPAAVNGEPIGVPLIEPFALPKAPVFMLREGRVRGQRVGVVAFSPFYTEDGVTKLAYRLRARLGDAVELDDHDLSQLMLHQPQANALFVPEPVNPFAFVNAIKVKVSHSGIQTVSGHTLLSAGLGSESELSKLHLYWMGAEIAMQVRDEDGHLDTSSELRFYAAPSANSMQVGDRWNMTDIYWLVLEADNGLRMATRAVQSGVSPTRMVGYEYGIWEQNQFYDSAMPGLDGDHWFAHKLSVAPLQEGVVVNPDTRLITPTQRLPLAPTGEETAMFTFTGSARSIATHTLQINLGAVVETTTWTNTTLYESWQAVVTTTNHVQIVGVSLLPGKRSSDIRLDKVYWRQPVHLNFSEQGARFAGVAGRWGYQLSHLPAHGALYDITNPHHPQMIDTVWNNEITFEDGPQAREYLVAGPGTLYVPAVIPHSTVKLSTDQGADAVYIAPADWHDELAPLIAHRRQEGYQVQLVDLQAIYDAWSYGQIAPDAIRNFLRYMVARLQPAPIAAILVGDSTVDPRHYGESQNPNILPAYLAEIDPWISETACENCYAQLDDDSPLAGQTDPSFLNDIWVGRLSVQNEEQLKTVVAKILGYETIQNQGQRSQSSLYVADNYYSPSGVADKAGDFAYYQDLVVVGDPAIGAPPLQSTTLPATRVYYDPRPEGVIDPWREPNAEQARLRTIQALKKGPILTVFNGHANHFQWASTIPTLPKPFLFGTNDIDEIQNLDRLGIVIELTCLTAQFVHLSTSGTTIDERFQRHAAGGAVAIWGSSGFTVAYGQQPLIRGFHKALWREPAVYQRLGELVTAGYFELFSYAVCCQETRKSYLLLGDPLTPAFIPTKQKIHLPIVNR